VRDAGRPQARRAPVGLFSGLVFALVPSVSRFAQEVRFYSLEFIAETGPQADRLYPVPCAQPAACTGAEPMIWVVGSGYDRSPYSAMTPAQAALLRPYYRVAEVRHVPSLTVFLLARKG
jgi:hypothetical protein